MVFPPKFAKSPIFWWPFRIFTQIEVYWGYTLCTSPQAEPHHRMLHTLHIHPSPKAQNARYFIEIRCYSSLLCTGDMLDLFQGEWRCWWRDVIKWRHTGMNDVTLLDYRKCAKSLCFREIYYMKWNVMMNVFNTGKRCVWSFAWSIHEAILSVLFIDCVCRNRCVVFVVFPPFPLPDMFAVLLMRWQWIPKLCRQALNTLRGIERLLFQSADV